MLKIIPDLHGRHWIAAKQTNELRSDSSLSICYLGDIVDSKTLLNVDFIHCYDIIAAQKAEFGDRVICLLGNHEMSYDGFPCSGYRAGMQPHMSIILKDKLYDWKIAHVADGTLITHAGVSRKWLDRHFFEIKNRFTEIKFVGNPDWVYNLAEALNKINKTHLKEMFCEVGYKRGGLRDDAGSPLWCDKSEMVNIGIKQIVGHTPVPEITEIDGVTYTDCLTTTEQFIYVPI